MNLSIQLTAHARHRLEERTSLAVSDFLALLANYQTVSVGYRRSSGHWHRLFFSEPDREQFVAIQDTKNGDIITVLPLDYHENLAWKIDEARKRRAVRIAAPSIHAELYFPAPISTPAPGAMDITGVFAPHGKKMYLGSHRFSIVPTVEFDALSDDLFVSKLFEQIARRNADLALLEEILLYERRTSAFLKLAWHSIEQFSLDFDLSKTPRQTAPAASVTHLEE